MNKKVWSSAAIDFGITFITAFMAVPTDVQITTRSLIAMVAGSALSTLKGLKTYYAMPPHLESKNTHDAAPSA